MYPTKNSLDQKIRIESVAILQNRLFDALDLISRTKQAHWNVKGENFIGLHRLFDELRTEADEWADLMAERIMQLGGMVAGTVHDTASYTHIPQYPKCASEGIYEVEFLSSSLAYFGEYIRVSRDELDRMHDVDSVDILTQISRKVDQYLWFVEAHTQAGKFIKVQKVVG